MNEESPIEEMPERKLMQAVIGQAMWDAFYFLEPAKSDKRDPRRESREREVIINRSGARVWFEGNGPDFRKVCDLAGVDPDYIRGKYFKKKRGYTVSPLKEAA